jgi:hypothetical protein
MAVTGPDDYYHVLILLILSAVVLLFPDQTFAQLTIDRTETAPGQSVIYTVSVANAPKTVNAFTMDVSYDHSVLKYTGYVQGNLTRTGYPLFGVNNREPGIIRIGGVGPQNPGIQSGGSGSIVQLKFDVIGEGNSNIEFMDLMDDIRDWPATAATSPTVPQETGGVSSQGSLETEAREETEGSGMEPLQSLDEAKQSTNQALKEKDQLSANDLSPAIRPPAEAEATSPPGFRFDGGEEKRIGLPKPDSGNAIVRDPFVAKGGSDADKAREGYFQSGFNDLTAGSNSIGADDNRKKSLPPNQTGKDKFEKPSLKLFADKKKDALPFQAQLKDSMIFLYQIISLILQSAILVMLVLIFRRLSPQERSRGEGAQTAETAEGSEPSTVVKPITIKAA